MSGWRQHRKRRDWVALVAAYALLLQALVSAFAIGASADPLLASDPIAVLCAHPGTDGVHDNGQTPAAPHLPDCCLTGCNFLGAALLPPPEAAGFPIPALVDARPTTPLDAVDRTPARRGVPANPRAPPLKA